MPNGYTQIINSKDMGGYTFPSQMFDEVITFNEQPDVILAVPGQCLMFDLVSINNDVYVDFPNAASAGQCIGLVVTNGDGVLELGWSGEGPIVDLGALPLLNTGESVVFTWDPDYPGGSAWVAAITAKPSAAPAASPWLTPVPRLGAEVIGVVGELSLIDGAQGTTDYILPPITADNQVAGYKTVPLSATVDVITIAPGDGHAMFAGISSSSSTLMNIVNNVGGAAVFVSRLDNLTWYLVTYHEGSTFAP